MRKRFENKFTMLLAVVFYLYENLTLVSSIPELLEHYNTLRALTSRITSKDEHKRTVVRGKSLRKLSEKNAVLKKAMAVSGAIYAYAAKTNNIELAENTNVFKSDLSKLRDTELVGILKTLKDIANEHLAALEPYGVTHDKYVLFCDKIQLYENAVTQSETSGAVRSGAVRSIKSMFEEASTLLVSLDRLINGLDEEHPEFVRDYYIARAIKNLGIRHKPEDPPDKKQDSPDS